MTGWEHYREAERLLEAAAPRPYTDQRWNAEKLAAARLHALLAAVAVNAAGVWPDLAEGKEHR